MRYYKIPQWVTKSDTTEYRLGEDLNVYSRSSYNNPTRRIKKLSPATKSPYLNVRIKGRTVNIHVIVAAVFHGERPIGYEVRHLDGNKHNNHPDNLCYGTKKDNRQDSIKHGTFVRGEKNGRAVLTDKIVRTIRRRYASGSCTQNELADAYGITRGRISHIVRRRGWNHVE